MSQNRYRNAVLVNDRDGSWISAETPFVDTSERWDDRYHVVQMGDRLDLLAHQYLTDARLWWIIAEYNTKFWMFDLEIGETLRIPSYEHVYLDLLR